MEYCERCGFRPREWLSKKCNYCNNLPVTPNAAIEYENKRKITHPYEFEDPPP